MFEAELRTKELRKCLVEVDKDMMDATRLGLQFAGKKLATLEKPMVRELAHAAGEYGPWMNAKSAAKHEFAKHNIALGRTPRALALIRKTGKAPSMGRPIPGLLRYMTHASRVRRTFRDQEWKLNVGPMGGRVNLYRKKINALDHFADKTYAAVPTVAKAEFEAKYARVMDKRRSQNPGRWGEG